MTEYKTMDDLGDLHGKVVMLRADLNVPMDENFHVTNTTWKRHSAKKLFSLTTASAKKWKPLSKP